MKGCSEYKIRACISQCLDLLSQNRCHIKLPRFLSVSICNVSLDVSLNRINTLESSHNFWLNKDKPLSQNKKNRFTFIFGTTFVLVPVSIRKFLVVIYGSTN